MTTLKPRWFHASTFLNSILYITGGTTKDDTGQESILDETLALDFSKPWSIENPLFITTMPRLTIPLTGHSMSVVPTLKHLLVVGGESTGNRTLESILLLDPKAAMTKGDGWAVPTIPTVSSMPPSTATPSSVVAAAPLKKTAPPITPITPANNLQYLRRTYHAAITTGKDGVLIQGGYLMETTSTAVGVANHTIVSSLVTLSPLRGFIPQLTTPVSVASNAPALARHTMTLTTDGRAIILGGMTSQGVLANLTSAYVMNTQSDKATWMEVQLLGKPPDPRMAFTTVMVNSTTLLLYGGTDDFKSAYWVTFYLDLPTWTWSSPKAGGIIPRRWGHTAAMVGNIMVVMFGLSSHQSPDSTPVVLLDTATNTWISRFTPNQMTDPTSNNPTNSGKSKSGSLSVIAILGIAFVFTAVLVIGIFCLLVNQNKRRTRNTLAKENLSHHIPREAIRKQQQSGDPLRSFLNRLRFNSRSNSNSSRHERYISNSKRPSAISPQDHPMSIAAHMTQLGHSPSSLGYPEIVVEHGTGMVPVSGYIYPNQPITDSESLAPPAPIAAVTGRMRMRRKEDQESYGALVVYHDLSSAQKEALSLLKGKQALS
ncbi:hypothetical protein FBU30_002790 [Linnemannia zychae]|nr:hypothetical protein FBU30_002790 [Linnemannia zychae]